MNYSGANEKWLPVPVEPYGKAYEVSNLGRVRSLPRLANSEYFIRHIHGGLMKGRERKDGTKTVTLSVQRQRTKFVIADLVAMAFGEVSANA
ncbi:NUMOD4 domain-containing protein [Pseudocitrobacter sp. 2023EL-00150]|uniref:NUMOD4 domain-containing protein n=1 Tax=Pseudocitrobacter sp. 2023EL-00150 TaxID=3032322 RepID=UPI0023E4119A|nr:NUMOD4 domain-containing protein [Pseudocitrobacter sp. 2023EL-00150]MDF3830256.1 NUMOD4 domain-containing protein [Pseudocitrobacter sp. 2023EL-00150]